MGPDELQGLLDIDLRSTSSSDMYFDGVTDLLSETKGVFPNSKLPIQPSKQLLDQLSQYNAQSQKWILPDSCSGQKSEIKLTEFLNNICNNIHTLTGQAPIRQWNSNFCDTVLEGSPISRKPDIILVDIDKHTPISWPSVRAVAEVTSHEPVKSRRISNTVTDKSYIILATQPDRVFVPVLSAQLLGQILCLSYGHRPSRAAALAGLETL